MSSSPQEDGSGSNNIEISQVQDSNEHSQAPNAQPPLKRKRMKERSVVWEHFEKIYDKEGKCKSAKCNYCSKVLCSNPSKNGTSSLLSHMHSCGDNTNNQETHQALLNLQPTDNEEGNVGVGTLSAWKFDQNEIREDLAYMIIIDELPFKFVEGEGFKRYSKRSCPRFKIPSRWTMARDCYQLYVNERSKLKSFMKSSCQRVSLTTDTWTSLQKINYMCITIHFIDNDWNLHKKILNFMPVSSHRGDYLGKALEHCLLDWGLKNVFTITVDNASANDTAIIFLKRRMLNWGGSIAACKYIHMRCIEHVISLVVSDGLKEVDTSVKHVRDVVKYIRNSHARFRKFKECVDLEGIESKSFLCLDVSTRWNSTYLMLRTAERFEKAFEKYDEQDSSFKADLEVDGVPSFADWCYVRKIADLLKHFYELTLRISGSLYVTSSSFFSKISDLCCILNEWKRSKDCEIKRLDEFMKTKFDKYWGDPEKMNKIIFWGSVFDPRDKFEYMEYSLSEMYGAEKGSQIFQTVKTELYELFNEYKNIYQPGSEVSDVGSPSHVFNFEEVSRKPASLLKAKYKKQKIEIGEGGGPKNELDIYLSEAIVAGDNLDVLK